MEGDKIDDYIAKFKNLVRRAEIPRHEVGVLEKFKDGLKRGIHITIMRCNIWPKGIDEWEEFARHEVCRLSIFREALGGGCNPFISTRQSKWQGMAQKAFKHPRNNEMVPMDINAARTEYAKGGNSCKIKQKCLHKEGRCFDCQQKGHLRQDCPKKPPYKPTNNKPWEKAKFPTQEAYAAKIEVGDETNTKKLAKQVAHLDERGKEDLFQVLLNGPDF